MPVEGINGFLDVESAALRAPQVGIANTNPQHILSVGSNLYVSGDSSDVLTVDGNVVCEGVKVGLIEITPSYDLEAVANVGNSTSNTILFTNPDTGIVATGNVSVGKTLTVDGIRITAAAEADVDLDAVVAAGPSTARSIQLIGPDDSISPYIGTLTIGTNTGNNGGLGVAGNVHVGRGLYVRSNLEVGTANLFVNTVNSRVGIGKTNPDATLDVDGDAIIRGDLSVLGTTTTIDTNNLRVQDPIIELGKDNTASPLVDLGLVMTRPTGSSNVAIIFDENADTLEIGYTDNDASATDITMVSTPLSVNVNGDLSVTSNVHAANVEISGDVKLDDGTNHPLTIDASSSMIYSKSLYFGGAAVDSYNYLGRFTIYSPPALFNILDSGTALGSGSRYSMSKGYGSTQPPIMNALEGSEFSTYRFYWEPEAAGGGSEESIYYHVWFSPSRFGNYTFYIHAKDYLFPTEPSSPTYNDVIYGMLNLLGSGGTQSHVVVGRPNMSGAATLQLHNESQVTGDRLTHEAIQLFSNTTPATGDISNVFITMTPSTTSGGYGGYIEGWIKSGTNSGLSLGNISSGTKYRGLTITSQGSVGIGTTNPVAPLHIGDYTTGSAGELLRLSGASSADRHFKFLNEDDAAVGGAGSNAVWVHDVNSSFGQYSFRTGNTELMRIKNNGNVGIGTSNPSKLLHIKQTVEAVQGPGNAIRIEQVNGGEYMDIGMDNDQLGADLYFRHSNGVEFIMGGDAGGYFNTNNVYVNTTLMFPDRLGSNPNSFAGSKQLIRTNDSNNGGLFQSTDRGALILGSPDDSLMLATGDEWVDSTFSASTHGVNLESENIYMVADGHLQLNVGIQSGWNAEYQYFDRLHHYLDGRGSGSAASHWTYYRNHGGSLYKVGYSGTNGVLEIHADNAIDMYESDLNDLVFKFDVNSDIMYRNGVQVIPSDDRLKINETRITNATQTLLKLDPQLYDKKRSLHSNILTHEAGFILQDVWYDAPEFRYLVTLADDAEPSNERPFTPDDIQDDPDWEGAGWGKKVSSLNYEGMLPFIVKSIQEIVTELPTEKTQVLSEGDLYGLIVSATTNTFTAGDKPILKLSNVYCDKACFGVVSAVKPASRLDSETLVNTNGSGRIWVLDTGTPLTSGDYLTTSNSVAGYAQIQPDDITRNYTVAKITQECDFIEKTRPKRIIKQKIADVNYYVKTNYINVTQDEYNALSQDKRTSEEEVYYECQGKERVESDQPYDYVKIKPDITMENYENLSDIEKSKYKLRYFKYVTYEEIEEPSADVTFERKTRTLYKRIVKQYYTTPKRYRELEVRQELVNALDEHGQIQWEDDPSGATEKAYKIRYLDADGSITDEANHVYKAAFVGCTYHCG